MREETFTVERGWFVRRVTPRRGAPYEHRCEADVYRAVAHAIDGLRNAPFSGATVHALVDAPWTQVYTALAFLKERGCIVPAGQRRHRAASDFVYEDALIEWHALATPAPDSR